MIGFYWIVKEELAGSSQPGLYGDWDEHISFLRKIGITSIVSLTEEPLIKESVLEENFEFYHLPIRDMDCPMPREAYKVVLYLKEAIEEGKKCLLHCKGGVGRTGMIAACYLVARGFNATDAINQVRTINRAYIQTQIQEQFITHFEQYYLKETDQ